MIMNYLHLAITVTGRHYQFFLENKTELTKPENENAIDAIFLKLDT